MRIRKNDGSWGKVSRILVRTIDPTSREIVFKEVQEIVNQGTPPSIIYRRRGPSEPEVFTFGFVVFIDPEGLGLDPDQSEIVISKITTEVDIYVVTNVTNKSLLTGYTDIPGVSVRKDSSDYFCIENINLTGDTEATYYFDLYYDGEYQTSIEIIYRPGKLPVYSSSVNDVHTDGTYDLDVDTFNSNTETLTVWLREDGEPVNGTSPGYTAETNIPGATITRYLDCWHINDIDKLSCVLGQEYTIWIYNSSEDIIQDIVLTYTDQEVTPPPTYTLTTAVTPDGSGTITRNPTGPYYSGVSVTLTAVPGNGYVFNTWTDGNTSNPREVVMNSNVSVVAKFEAVSVVKVTLNMLVEGGAWINNSSFDDEDYGQEVDITSQVLESGKILKFGRTGSSYSYYVYQGNTSGGNLLTGGSVSSSPTSPLFVDVSDYLSQYGNIYVVVR